MGSAPTPPLAFVEASPGDASLLDEMVAGFHVCENVEMSSDARRRVIAALLANPAQGRVLLFTLPDATICGCARSVRAAKRSARRRWNGARSRLA